MTKYIHTGYSFHQGYNTQQCLLVMVEKRKENLDNCGQNSPLMTISSKAFDFFNYILLIPKQDTYGFVNQVLAFVYSYFSY